MLIILMVTRYDVSHVQYRMAALTAVVPRFSLGSFSERHAGGLAVGRAGPGDGGRLGGRRTPGREGHTRTERRVPPP